MQAARGVENLKQLVDMEHPELSVRKQCELLGVSRSALHYTPVEICEYERRLRLILDKIYMEDPSIGTRKLVDILDRDHQMRVNRKRIQRIRREMGLETIYCRPRTSIAEVGGKRYPYLLKEIEICRPDQVWCADITYVPMGVGHAYLCAVMDWYSRKVLGWRLSNTMDIALCIDALNKALIEGKGIPEIFNTDQGSQFTSEPWISKLEENGIQISMDGKGRWMDNIFIERLWRTVKYEHIYLRSYNNIYDQEQSLKKWFEKYNRWRPHQTLGNKTPDMVYEKT